MINKTVNWKIFDIDSWNEEDVSKTQVVEEFKKFNGNSKEFEKELAKRCQWSGFMLEIVDYWLGEVEK